MGGDARRCVLKKFLLSHSHPTPLVTQPFNGDNGGSILFGHYVDEVPWYAFTESERALIEKTARRFTKALQGGRILAAHDRPNSIERKFQSQ